MLILSDVNGRCCMFWCNSIGVFSFLDGNWLNLSARIISFPGFIGVCNHTFVVVEAFFVILELLCVLAFWLSTVVVCGHYVLWCVFHRCRCKISLTQRLPKGILILCWHVLFLCLLRSWKQMQWVCCFLAVQHIVHIHWHLFARWVVVFCHSMLKLFSKGCCRSIALIVEMHYLLRVSNPIVKLVP